MRKICGFFTSKGSQKKKGRCCVSLFFRSPLLTLAFLFFYIISPSVFALPSGEEVISGTADFQTSEDHTTLNITASDQSIIQYQSFNLLENETVNFLLPSADAISLNRIVGFGTSTILGRVTANGNLMLVNQNGFYFGAASSVEAPNVVISTHDISNANFLSGNFNFRGLGNFGASTSSSILNEGTIRTSAGGNAVLIADAIENRGTIEAPIGKVTLAAGNFVTIQITQNGWMIGVSEETAHQILDAEGNPISQQVKNTGTLKADGGTVTINARAANQIFESAVNMQGIVRADQFVANPDGGIRIVANGDVMLDASMHAARGTIAVESEGDIAIQGGEYLADQGQVSFESDTQVIVSGAVTTQGNTSVRAKEDIEVNADWTTDSGHLLFQADSDLDGQGAFLQAEGTTLRTTTSGDITISASGESTLGSVDAAGELKLLQAGAAVSYTQYAGSSVKTGGSLTIGAGATLKAANTVYEVSQNWVNLGAFDAQLSLVKLVGPLEATVYGSNTFNDFTVVEPGKKVNFEAGAEQEIVGTLTLQGGAGNLLLLRSTIVGVPWLINAVGITHMSYLDLMDASNVNIHGPPVEVSHSNFTSTQGFSLLLSGASEGPVYLFGGNSFVNFQVTSPSQVIYFQAGSTTTISGLFHIEGAYGEHVRLVSSQSGSEYFINHSGATDITYGWVEDMHYTYLPNPGQDLIMSESTNRGGSTYVDPTGTWTNGGGDGLWSNVNNWAGLGGATPGAGDDVVFDGTSNTASSVDGAWGGSVGSLSMNAGYTSTITLNRSLTVTTASGRSGSVTLNSGTLSQNNQSLTIGGNLTIANGATFTKATSGSVPLTFNGSGTITDNNGTKQDLGLVVISGSSTRTLATAVKMVRLEIGAGSTFSLAGNDLTFSSGNSVINDGTFRLQGNETLTNVSDLDFDSGLVEYVGNNDGVSDTWTIKDFGATDYYNLKINDTSGTQDIFSLGAALVVAGDLAVASGTLSQGANTITALTYTQSGGTFNGGSSNITIASVATITGGTMNTTSAILQATSMVINAPGIVRMAANGTLKLATSGSPLTGTGTLDTTTNSPNTVEFTSPGATDISLAGPAVAFHHLNLGLLSFSETGQLIEAAPVGSPSSLVIDTANGFAYVGTIDIPGKIVKVSLSSFTRVGVLSFDSGGQISSAIIDTVNGFAYYGTNSNPGTVVKVDLSTFTQAGSLTLNSGEDDLFSAVIDTANGFAYFGADTSPGIVVKIDLSTFARVGALTLNAGENSLRAPVIDTANGFAYFGTFTSPGIVVKINLSNFTRTGALTLNSGENSLFANVIDTANGFAYFGTNTSPGIVVKVNLLTFTRVGALTLNAGENSLRAPVIDTANDFVYFGTSTSPGIVVKVNLSTFTRVGALTLNSGESLLRSAAIDTANGFAYFLSSVPLVKVDLSSFTRTGALLLNSGFTGAHRSAVIDTANGFAYFGSNNSPGVVVKVNLSTFTRVGVLTLNSGENSLYSAVIDTTNGFAYFGTLASTGLIVKVNLSTFTRAGALTLNAGETQLYSAVIDTINGFAYFGTFTSPGRIVKINLSTFTRTGALTLNSGENSLASAVIDTTNGFAYFGTGTSPGRVVKINLSNFTRTGALTLNAGESFLSSAVIDTTNGFAYFGTSAGIIAKINLSTFTRTGALTLNAGESNLTSAVIDTTNGFAYFGTSTSPGIVVKVNLSTFTRTGAVTLNSGENILLSAVIDTTNGFAYFGTGNNPGIVVRVSLGNTPTFTLGTADGQTLTVNGTLTIGDGTNAVIVNATTRDPVIDVNGNFLLNALSTFIQGSGAMSVAGNFTLNSGSTFTKDAAGLITFDGTGSLTDSNGTKQDLGHIVIGGSTTTRTLASGIKMTSLTINSGNIFSLAGNNFNFSASAAVSNSGTFRLQGGEVLTNVTNLDVDSGTVEYVGIVGPYTVKDFGASDYYNLIFNGSGATFNIGTALTVMGDLTLTAGTLGGSSDVTVNGGDVTGNGDINLTAGTFLLDGAGNFGGNTAWDFYDLTFGNGVGATTTTKTGSGSITAARNLTIAANQTLDGGDDTWNVGGNWTNSGSFLGNGSTVVLNGSADQSVTAGGSAFNHFTVNNTGIAGSDDITFVGNLDVDGNFTLSNGNFHAPGVMNVGDDFLVTNTAAAAFDANGGVVILDSLNTSVVNANAAAAGTITFYDLRINTAGKTVQFGAGDTFNVTNATTWEVTGAAGNLITLMSTTAGVQWTVNAAGTNITYANVTDSNNTGLSVINCFTGCVDGAPGNTNTNWLFALPVTAPPPALPETGGDSAIDSILNNITETLNESIGEFLIPTVYASEASGITAQGFADLVSQMPSSEVTGFILNSSDIWTFFQSQPLAEQTVSQTILYEGRVVTSVNYNGLGGSGADETIVLNPGQQSEVSGTQNPQKENFSKEEYGKCKSGGKKASVCLEAALKSRSHQKNPKNS